MTMIELYMILKQNDLYEEFITVIANKKGTNK